jgi:hypothetical protein
MRVAWLAVFLFVVGSMVSGTASAQKPAPPAAAPPVSAPAASAAPAPPAPGAPGAAPAAPDQAKKDEAIARFKTGLDHFDRQEWSAALAEFLKSRELYPSRAATKNAAVCMRKEGRFDEALELYEELLKNFPDLSPADKDFATKEIQTLQGSIGTVDIRGAEPGATVVVDGRNRGTYPLPGPMRISAGSHVVRVFKEGFLPFESRVDIAGQQMLPLEAHLGAMVQSGRLHVAEQTGRALDAVVDGVVIGKTPWEGSLAVGDHTLVLRGDGNLGTQPVAASVKLNQLTSLTLIAEDLDAIARVDPQPAGATVSVDGVAVGRGVWEGKLRVGGHVFEASLDGYLPFKREMGIGKGERQVILAKLDRDPNAVVASQPGHFALEVDGGLVIVPLLGGDLASSCTGSCSAGLPLGGLGLLHAEYVLAQGFGFGLEGGYDAFSVSYSNRPTSLSALNTPQDNGNANDKVNFGGLLIGLSALYRIGDTWPVTLRFGIGAYLASVKDTRTGSFTTSAATNPPKETYTTPAFSESSSGTFLYAAPELRFGRRFGEHFEINVGVVLRVLATVSQPAWNDGSQLTIEGPTGGQGDGLGGYGKQNLTGPFVFAAEPGLGARYTF